MRRPKFMGLFRGHEVFRIASRAALRRIWPKAVPFEPRPFDPGLYLAVGGVITRIPAGFADVVRHGAECSSPRLARAIRALDQVDAMRGDL